MKFLKPLRAESADHLHLDCLRVIASLGIVAFHWKQELRIPGVHIAVDDQLQFLGNMVDLFFVISGFIIADVYAKRLTSGASYGRFLLKRVARLGPLHWITLAFFVAVGLLAIRSGAASANPEKYDFSCVAPEVFFLHAAGGCHVMAFNGPSWSISAEMVCYVLFPLMLLGYRRSPATFGLAALACIAACYATDYLHPSRPWYDFTAGNGFARALPEFALGVALHGVRRHLARIPAPGWLLGATMLALPVLALAGVTRGALVPWLYLIVALAVAADLQRKSGRMVTAAAPWGSLTYSLYMLHTPFHAIVFSGLIDNKLHLDGAARNVAVGLSVVALVTISYLSLELFEKPMRDRIGALPLFGARRPVQASAVT